jgi:hypothetical protein
MNNKRKKLSNKLIILQCYLIMIKGLLLNRYTVKNINANLNLLLFINYLYRIN